MYDLKTAFEQAAARELPHSLRAMPSCGPMASSDPPRGLARMLDVVDYGMLVVEGETTVAYANQMARAELALQDPLLLAGGELRARSDRDTATLRQALLSASQRGLQAMAMLTAADGHTVNLSVIPLLEPDLVAAALVVVGRRRVCEDLSADAFGRQHGLTPAEARVLKLLCSGCRPRAIAQAAGVSLNTVRTQISSIRDKTGSRDIGDILHRLARLPPLACVLRHAG